MPTKPKRPCRQIGCPALTESNTGYCDKHKSQSSYRLQRTDKAEREVYRSRRWTELSKAKRQADQFCERCQRAGRITPATLVHHKVPIKDGGDPWEWGNLESVCGGCQRKAHTQGVGKSLQF